jgi:hypothetical protein
VRVATRPDEAEGCEKGEEDAASAWDERAEDGQIDERETALAEETASLFPEATAKAVQIISGMARVLGRAGGRRK